MLPHDVPTSWPSLPPSSADKQSAASLACKLRLERLAEDAIRLGSREAASELLRTEREAFEAHSPAALESLRRMLMQLSEGIKTCGAETIVLGAHTLRTPVWATAPMVTQCDLPFRLLTRRYGARLVYSEMLMASEFAASARYREIGLGLRPGDTCVPADDHPLVVQFAANTPEALLHAGIAAQRCGADAIDLNLGCPQNRARDGHYGSFLADQDDWDLVCQMVRACVQSSELIIPVTCKIRLQPTVEATIEFAQRLEQAGCALLAVHGRRRGNERHRRHGPADLDAIRRIRASLTIPVLTNGNVSSSADALDALRVTGCHGVMSAEELLRDPVLFARCDATLNADHRSVGRHGIDGGGPPANPPTAAEEPTLLPDAVSVASQYLALCERHPPSSVWAVGRMEDGPIEVCCACAVCSRASAVCSRASAVPSSLALKRHPPA